MTRHTLLELFRSLQHPYIHPVLDIEFWDAGAALISPLNPSGSLKDLIYGSLWHEDYEKKYTCRGEGLPLRTVSFPNSSDSFTKIRKTSRFSAWDVKSSKAFYSYEIAIFLHSTIFTPET